MFRFEPKQEGGFDGEKRKVYFEKSLYVNDVLSNRTASLKDHIHHGKEIHSNQIQFLLDRFPKNLEKKGLWTMMPYPSVNLDEKGLINQLSHFFARGESARLKDEHGCSRADLARELLIENLKSVKADVYIDDRRGKILSQIKNLEINTSNLIYVREMFKAYDLQQCRVE